MHRPSQIQRRPRFARPLALFAAVTLLAAGPTACKSTPDRIDYAAVQTPEDEAFLKGVNRPAAAPTLFAMARMLINQGRVAEAELVLRRAIEQDPRFVPAYLELSEMALRRERVGDAAQILTAALEIAPKDGRLLNNLGMCWLLRGEHELALDAFVKAAGAMPDDARPRANAATALGLMGRYEESFAAFSQVMSPAEAHFNVAILCEARNDRVRADQEFAAAEALDATLARAAPSSPDIK